MRSRLLITVVVALLLHRSGPAVAQPAADARTRAEALNDEGKARIKVVDLEGATQKFREAIALSPDGRFYFNLCYTLDKLGKLREARAACEQAAASDNADARLTDKARLRLAEIDARIEAGKDQQPAGDDMTVLDPGDTLADGESVAAQPAVTPTTGAEARPAAIEPGTVAVPVTAADVAAALPRTILAVRLGLGRAELTGFEMDGAIAPGSSTVSGRTGFAVGGGVTYWLGLIGLQVDLLLSRKGASFELRDAGFAVDGSIDLTYLDLATLARFQPNRVARFRPFGLAGLQFSSKLSGEISADGGESETLENVSDGDFGVVFGGGAAFGAPRRGFAVDLRYIQGLTDVSTEFDDTATVKNRVFIVMFGFEL